MIDYAQYEEVTGPHYTWHQLKVLGLHIRTQRLAVEYLLDQWVLAGMRGVTYELPPEE